MTEDTTVQEATPEASTQVESQVSEPETQETENTEQVEETESPQVQDSEGEKKLTRGERRKQQLAEQNEQTRSEIQDLLQQQRQALEAKDQVQKDPKSILDELLQGNSDDDDSIITADDYGKELDPQELNRRHKERLAKTQDKISKDVLSRVRNELKLENALNEHERDANEVLNSEELKSNPTLKELVEQQYMLQNRVLGANGQYQFVPAITMSQTLQMLKGKLSTLTGKQQAELQTKLQEQADTSAITPSQQTPTDHKQREDAESFEYARRSGRTEDWANVLKKRMFG